MTGIDGKQGIKMIDCHTCRHYYVTWEKDLPHGCRGIGFKSALLPAVAVFQNSSTQCLLFEEKRISGNLTMGVR
jgi:hypothetical protein